MCFLNVRLRLLILLLRQVTLMFRNILYLFLTSWVVIPVKWPPSTSVLRREVCLGVASFQEQMSPFSSYISLSALGGGRVLLAIMLMTAEAMQRGRTRNMVDDNDWSECDGLIFEPNWVCEQNRKAKWWAFLSKKQGFKLTNQFNLHCLSATTSNGAPSSYIIVKQRFLCEGIESNCAIVILCFCMRWVSFESKSYRSTFKSCTFILSIFLVTFMYLNVTIGSAYDRFGV